MTHPLSDELRALQKKLENEFYMIGDRKDIIDALRRSAEALDKTERFLGYQVEICKNVMVERDNAVERAEKLEAVAVAASELASTLDRVLEMTDTQLTITVNGVVYTFDATKEVKAAGAALGEAE